MTVGNHPDKATHPTKPSRFDLGDAGLRVLEASYHPALRFGLIPATSTVVLYICVWASLSPHLCSWPWGNRKTVRVLISLKLTFID